MNPIGNRSLKYLLLKLFLAYYMVHPTVYFLSLIISSGIGETLNVLKIIALLAPPIILSFTLAFYFLASRLGSALNERESDKGGRAEALLEAMPLRAMVLLTVGCSGGPMLTVIIGYSRGVFLTAEQCVFFFLIGLIQAAIAGGLLYFNLKIVLYTYLLKRKIAIRFTPLTLFQKLFIPVTSSIVLLLIFASVGIYRIVYNQTYAMYSSTISARISRNTIFTQSLFEKTISQLDACAKSSDARSMSPSFLKMLHEDRGSDIEMYFIADTQGNSVNSVNLAAAHNIRDRAYFRQVMETKKYAVSEPVVNKQTGKTIIVAAVPVMGAGGNPSGVMGATILMEKIENMLKQDTIVSSGRYMIISKSGKMLLHKNRGIVGKTIGKDPELTDDGRRTVGIKSLVMEKENTFFSYVFNGESVFSYKSEIPVLGHYLVFSMDKRDFLQRLRFIIIEILAAITLLIAILLIVIRFIAQRFSVPIHNTIEVIGRLADGDLKAESTDFIADEFGELIRHFRDFQGRLRDIIGEALNAVLQLSTSAEQLASTSNSMSNAAQTQAASIEEASSSIEEISSAIELINTNANSQASLAKTTFSSMEKLKTSTETVTEYAKLALAAAKKTTEQASSGQSLMKSTIAGMNNIDESTKKISETVDLISDISDQVNLLALNASIEAARAGEHGKGFAVVAEEISKLADQTASGAKSISEFVSAGIREVQNGRSFVDATGKAFESIIEFISQTEDLVKKITDAAESQAASSSEVLGDTRRVMEMADEISNSTREQMTINQEMSKTVDQINISTQTSAAAAEQLASSAEEISAQAESLRQQIQFFSV